MPMESFKGIAGSGCSGEDTEGAGDGSFVGWQGQASYYLCLLTQVTFK